MFDASRGALEEALSDVLGERVRVEISPEGESPPAPDLAAPASAERGEAPSSPVGERVEDHPLVRSAIELFNAEIVDVRPLNPAPE